MVWVGRDLKEHLVQTPLPWAGTPSTTPCCPKPHPAWPWCHVKGGGKGILISGKRRALPLSHEVQRRFPCFLNSLSEESLGAAGSIPSPKPGQQFMSKGLSV